MRKGFDGLSAEFAQVLKADPFSSGMFVFRGKRGDYLKILTWDGSGLVGYEDFDSSDWPIATARSVSRFHRLLCLTGGFGPGASYK